MAKKSLTILGIRGIPAAHGGFETFAHHLALWLEKRDWDVTVYCQGSETGRREESVWEGIRLIHIPIKRDGPIGTIEFDIKSTADAVKHSDRILTLGYNTGFLSLWPRMKGIPNFINMDGLEWKRAKYSFCAKAYLWVNERLAAYSGNRLIADHPAIADHLARRVSRSKIDTIPYGSDAVVDANPDRLESLGVEPGKFLTVIARPEPENSILEIVQAFSKQARGMKLLVLGKYDRAIAYQASVLDAASSEVVFPGAIYDHPTLHALRLYSLCYMHGHQVGGTNPSLVEALGAGNAVIAHDNPFNRWVAGDAGLYFNGVEECASHLDTLIAQPVLRQSMSMAARRRWEENFTWTKVLEHYEALLSSPASVSERRFTTAEPSTR